MGDLSLPPGPRTTRRRVIQGAAALAVAAEAAQGGAARAATALPLHCVAFDGRHAACLTFAGEAKRLGARVVDTRDDITGLYAGELIDAWRTAPAAVAGLTPYAQFFPLRLMAEGAGLRVVHLAHHDTGFVFGPKPMRARLMDLSTAAGADRAAARLLTDWPRAEVTVAAARSNIAAADDKAVAADTLVSWLIAPARRPDRV